MERKRLTPEPRLVSLKRRRFREPAPDRGPVTHILLGKKRDFKPKHLRGLGKSEMIIFDRHMEHAWVCVWRGKGYVDLTTVNRREDAEREISWLQRGSPRMEVEWLSKGKDNDQADRASRGSKAVRGQQRSPRHPVQSVRGRERSVRRTYKGGRFVDAYRD